MVQKYFNQLNYTLGNEDTSVDCELIKRLGSKEVFNVAGCGSRSFPLLESADSLTMVDVSPYQLSLCRLREELYRKLSFEDFLLFFDYPPYHAQDNKFRRKEIFLSLELPEEDRKFFKKLFEELNWGSLLYTGKWERTFQTMSVAVRKILGKDYAKITEIHSLEEQKAFYNGAFPKWRWNTLLFLLGNKSVFNALLYKGDFIEKNSEGTHFDYYKESFDTLFTNSLARKSFFVHLCFFGRLIHTDGNPIEAIKSNFLSVKEKIESGAEIEYWQGDLVSLLEKETSREKFDYLGLSDVPSYFKGDLEKNFIQRILPSLKTGGVIVLRNYLRTPQCEIKGLIDITAEFTDLFKTEKVGVYRIQVFKKV